MGAVNGDEDPALSHSTEEEGEDHSSEDGTVSSEKDATEERAGPVPDAFAKDHGLEATARGHNLDHGTQKVTIVARPSSMDELLEESLPSSTGLGVPPVARSASVEAGLRNLTVSEGEVPGKGE